MSVAWVNGQFVDEAATVVSVRDTGLLHAAGVFTTMRADGGKVFGLARHLKRIRGSCETLFIPLQFEDAALADAVAGILQRNQLSSARLRLTVTRGWARNDPVHGLRLEPTVFLTATGLEEYPAEFYERGMTVIVVDEQKLNPYDAQAGHKTLNYFSRLAALRSASQRGAGEAVWFDVKNNLQSGSISNLFLVKNGALMTAATREENREEPSAVLPGVTRSVILELAGKAGIEVKIGPLTIHDLLGAEECFLTNSIMRIMPVCRIEREAIGADRPGEITRRLMKDFADRVRGEGD